MKRTLIIAVAVVGLSACTVQQRQFIDNLDETPAPPAVVDAPTFPPCDDNGYYEMHKDAWDCVHPPMRTDCPDGQFLTKAGYFECRQPPDQNPPAPTDNSIPVK